MNIETVIERPKIIHRASRPLPVEILLWIQRGCSLRQIHAYLPGASWATIADTIYDAYWKKLLVEAITQ